MTSQFRPSFSGHLGSCLGKAWRNLVSKLSGSRSLTQSPRRQFFVTAVSKLLCVFGLAAVALAFALLIITNLTVALLRSWWENDEPVASRDESVPDSLGADLYIGDYDSNGHYIGDFKSPD
ncbi:hypothetical protein [Pseudomonas sp. CIP-10]|uniref:hypothetical protein n=1 Tax=Pseudomonas sp. CIP-10 TaxID=2892442 RepID=UPI001E3F732D|nr:hypothetical protein [Pseudomonas sp. CIP-10]UFH29266.1 hypothetical protein LMH93_11910 [Pseudomonas sp. CIP-10]